MTNAKYWQKRFEILERKTNEYARRGINDVIPVFTKAQREIENQIMGWYKRLADNNQLTMAAARKLLTTSELEEFKWTVEEYIKYGKKNAVDQQWVKELENASARFHISRLEALKVSIQQVAEVAFGNELDVLDRLARKIITESFDHTAYEIQRGVGIGWEIGTVDQRRINKLITTPWTTDKLTFSDRIWKSKLELIGTVETELQQNILLGKAPDKAIKNLAHRFSVSKSQAGRLIMTESSYFHSVSQKEAFNDLGVEQYEVVATLDYRTSEICQEMDKKHFPMKDYEPGVTAPPFHPWCRSVTAPYFDDDFGSVGKRAARDAKGNVYYVPADMTYREWAERYLID